VSDEPKYRDEEWLREQYVERSRSTIDIADECGCHSGTVGRWLDRYDIETRPAQPAADERLNDKKWLRKEYVKKERSAAEIALDCDCSDTTVLRALKRNSIKTRPRQPTPDVRLENEDWLRAQYIKKGMSTIGIAEKLGCSHNAVWTWLNRHGIDTRNGGPQSDERLKDSQWMHQQYVEEGQTTYEIASECGCAATTVSQWLRRHGIEARELAGKNHPNWRGGRKAYGPGWDPSKRRQVRERDDHTCQDPACSVTQDDHLNQYDEKLHVHHLIKARDIDDPEERNAPENLITLCRDCHREWERLSEAGIRPQIDGVTAD